MRCRANLLRLTIALCWGMAGCLAMADRADASAPRAHPPAPVLDHRVGTVLIRFTTEAIARAGIQLPSQPPGSTGIATSPVSGLAAVDEILRANGLRRVETLGYVPVRDGVLTGSGLDRTFSAAVDPATDVVALAAELLALPGVEDASPDWLGRPAVAPNDSYYADQWGHDNRGQMKSYCWGCGGHPAGTAVGTVGFDADIDEAWNGCQRFGDPSIVIAIIDTGADLGHPDLRLVSGYDFGDNDATPQDDSNFSFRGHGTNCAGVAAAIADNNRGVAGVAAGTSVMPLKISDYLGNAPTSAIAAALTYAADNGAQVASMSYSFPPSSTLQNAIGYASSAGVTLLAAAGNNNASSLDFPAAYGNVIAIGAASPCGERKRSSSNSSEVNPGVNTDPLGVTCDDERWWGSNYGTGIDFIAPTIIPSTDIRGSAGFSSGDYNLWFNGTSASTPFAAGVAALILSRNPALTPAQIKQAMVSAAVDVTQGGASVGYDTRTGYGMVSAAAALGPIFTDVTSSVTALAGQDAYVAWGDYDGDGDDDLYQVWSGVENTLYRNDGSDIFVDVSAAPVNDRGNGRSASWGDYDNDGDADLYLLNAYPGYPAFPSRLFRNDGGGAFAYVTTSPLDSWGLAADWADIDNDGDLDVLVNDRFQNRVFRNDGGSGFVDAGSFGTGGESVNFAFGDYDGDGDLDLYMVNAWSQPTNTLFRNDGGSFVNVAAGPLADINDGDSATWADYDNDGDLDAYLVNFLGPNRLIRNEGGGTFVNVTTTLLADPSEDSRAAAFLDYDLDGDQDLMVVNVDWGIPGQGTRILRNTGNGFEDATGDSMLVRGAGGWIGALTDHDLDGDVDVFLNRRVGVPSKLLRNETGCGNHWIQVAVAGTQSNVSGVGARVRVVTGALSQVREIVAGSGAHAQHSLVAMFGVGQATSVDTIQVLWPSGTVQTVTGGFMPIAVDTRITLEEPETPVAVGDGPPAPAFALRVHPATPNPFRAATTIRYEAARSAPVELRIYDTGGRLVRTLGRGESAPSGEREVTWDGRDDRGRPARAGVYFIRVRSAGRENVEKLLRIY